MVTLHAPLYESTTVLVPWYRDKSMACRRIAEHMMVGGQCRDLHLSFDIAGNRLFSTFFAHDIGYLVASQRVEIATLVVYVCK
jgi:hypothetical protein